MRFLNFWAVFFASWGIAAQPAFAWGARGHDIATRVGVTLMIEASSGNENLQRLFAANEDILAHLSNVPDFHWRSVNRKVRTLNAPTHYYNLEYTSLQPSYETTPKTISTLEEKVAELCYKRPRGYICPVKIDEVAPKAYHVGTATWRVEQLFNLMRADFIALKKAETPTDRTQALNQVLLHAGIMSHFVADLSVPYHATRDYDGWEAGLGGSHKFFETKIVSSFDNGLRQQVYNAANQNDFMAAILAKIPSIEQTAARNNPLSLSTALALQSWDHIASVNSLDLRYAILERSWIDDYGKRYQAVRRPAHEVAEPFQNFAAARLAIGAQLLAHLWHLAYEQAGKPIIPPSVTYSGTKKPQFINPDYSNVVLN